MRTISRIRTPTGRPRGPIATTGVPFATTTVEYTDVGVAAIAMPLNLATGIPVYIVCRGAGSFGVAVAGLQNGGGGGAWADKRLSFVDPGEVFTFTIPDGNVSNPAFTRCERGAVIKTTVCLGASALASLRGEAASCVGDRTFSGGTGGSSGGTAGGGGGGGAKDGAAGTDGSVGSTAGGAGGSVGGGAGGASGALGKNGSGGGGAGGHGFFGSEPSQTISGSKGYGSITYSSIGAPHS